MQTLFILEVIVEQAVGLDGELAVVTWRCLVFLGKVDYIDRTEQIKMTIEVQGKYKKTFKI